ncbi:MAG: hypothetical protein NDJ94_04825 [Vicinamibacteria bacterium]|nr:hypothetical protein [Vicinamibacteria bacterium]
MRVALVSCLNLDQPDHDFEPLRAAFAARGHEAVDAAWDDPAVAWGGFDAAVLRATWDYFHRRDAFLAWCEATAAVTRLLNPPEIVRWSTHKFYLRDLEARGVPILPTLFLPRGSGLDLVRELAARGWEAAVIKPAVSADSFGTYRVERGAEAEQQPHLDELLERRDMLVQRYLPTVVEPGERSHVVVDGVHSHAIRKRSLWLGGRHAGPEGVAVEIADDERAAVARALAALPFVEAPLYARVDLLRDEAGTPRVLELELVEPSLFFAQGPGSAERLVAAVERRVGRP